MQRNLNDIFEIQLNFIGCQCVSEAIERLLEFGLQISERPDNFVNDGLVQQAARSVNEQTDVFVKFDVRRKLHRSDSHGITSSHLLDVVELPTLVEISFGRAVEAEDQASAESSPPRGSHS